MTALVTAAARAARFAAACPAGEGGTASERLALASVCRVLDPSAATETLWRTVLDEAGDPAWMAGDLITGLAAAAGAIGAGGTVGDSALAYVRLLAEIRAETPSASGALLAAALDGADDADEPWRPGPGIIEGLQAGLRAPAFTAALSAIEAGARFGLTPVAQAAVLAPLLEGAAVAAFRGYDLPRGLRLLRARAYVAPAFGPGVEVGRAFVLSAQGLDGGFGDYDTAISQLEHEGQAGAGARLRLPVSFQSLWTLADLGGPDQRLMRRLFGPGLLALAGAAT